MKSRSKSFFLFGLLGALLTVLIAGRLMLPSVIKRVANEKLAQVPGYTAHVDDVSLALWRGAFSLKDVIFKHNAGDMDLVIPVFEFQIKWLPLLRRTVIAKARIDRPEIRILAKKPIQAAKKAKEKTKEAKETVEQKTGQSIPDLVASLIPFKIDRLVIKDGNLRFQDEKGSGLEARVTHIDIEVDNLTNTRKVSDTMMATGNVSAMIMDSSPLHLGLRINPVAREPKFDLSIALKQLPLTEVNAVLDWQWGILAEKGSFSLYSESAAADGAFKGYIKPLIHDLKIGKKPHRGPLQTVKEVVVKTVSHILKNNDTKTIGTEVPFAGRFENPKAGIWEAIIEVLRNAFIEALRADFDPSFKKRGLSATPSISYQPRSAPSFAS